MFIPAVVRGLYAYQARGPDEINIEEGGMYELSSGPEGGQYYADGWWEGPVISLRASFESTEKFL